MKRLREQIFANQKRLGVIPANTQLTPWPDDLPKWETLSFVQKKLYARQAEVFAAYAAYTDHEIGRVIQAVEDMGKLDNTLIIYISGDNGTSAEGTLAGTPNQMTAYNGILSLPEVEQMLNYEAWGSEKTYPHMSVAWSWAFDTPFKWTKQVASHFGGTRQGMAIAWPGHIKDAGGIRHQFHHMIDIVPTILEATGIQAPRVGQRHRAKAHRRREHGLHVRQGECQGSVEARDAVFRDVRQPRASTTTAGSPPRRRPPRPGSWERPSCPTINDYKWELYNLTEDFSQYNDLAAKNPDKLRELQALFLTEAAKYNVLPLDNSILPRLLTPRPSAVAGRTVFTYSGENAGIPVGNAPSILDKDYTITAEVTIPKGGAEGMIATMGGRFGGYGLYLLKGKPVFVYNLLDLKRYRWEGGVGGADWFGRALKPGKHTIVFDFKYDGPGPGKGGTGVLSVDGKELARQTIPHTIPILMSIDETFDIGVDTRTAVDDSYKLPFRFTGKIDKLTFKLGPSQLAEEDQRRMREALARARD